MTVRLHVAFGASVRPEQELVVIWIGMGDAGEQVIVYMQRAGATGVVARQAVAAGFGSLTRAEVEDIDSPSLHDTLDEQNKDGCEVSFKIFLGNHATVVKVIGVPAYRFVNSEQASANAVPPTNPPIGS